MIPAVPRARASGVIPAPPAEVYALLADPARMAQLASGDVEIVSTEDRSDGTRLVRTRTTMPSGAIVDAENVTLERVPNERIVVVSTVRPFGFAPTARLRFGRMVSRRETTLAPDPGGTLVTTDFEFQPSPFLLRTYFAAVKRGQWQRAADAALAQLRDAFAPPPPR